MPGIVVRVVKSISDASECVPVSFDIRVDCIRCHNFNDDTIGCKINSSTFPTEGKPTNPTDAIPVLRSKRLVRLKKAAGNYLPCDIEAESRPPSSTAG